MDATHEVDRLGRFVVEANLSDIGASLPTLKRNVLDSIACALGALDGELIPAIRAQAEEFSSRPTATLIGGGRASVDQAAFFNAALVRYPDLLDTFLTPGGLCHPADNFGAILAMAEHVGASGAGFLLALAVAYEVQCRFSAQVPVMARGLNHALQLTMSVAAGAAKLLRVRRRPDRLSYRRISCRQRVAGRRTRRAGVGLERNLPRGHRDAGGIYNAAGRPRNLRPSLIDRGTTRTGAIVRSAHRFPH